MIISASRRTDIPAFFGSWFFQRIKEGFVYVRNPMNINQISKIELSPSIIECIVFWTKNPSPDFINNLHILDSMGYKYYFQFTLTPYNQNIERNIPLKTEIINKFISLSNKIGKEKIIWRYDPILLNNETSLDCHKNLFEYYAKSIGVYTNKCIISFIDIYQKIKERLLKYNIQALTRQQSLDIAQAIQNIASKYNIKTESCCEDIDLSEFNIEHGHCIDGDLINTITGKRYSFKKDKTQRNACGCISSIDIGAYNTCRNGCAYCYANWLELKSISDNFYDFTSPLLCSNVTINDKISNRLVAKCDLLDNELFS
jgi:hypothetical protein